MSDLYPAIRRELGKLPEASRWPTFLELADDLGEGAEELPFWEYPLIACQAGGADPGTALPAAGAVFCLVASIRLVDDILDGDEVAPFRTLGEGPVANLALAFQAAAGRLVHNGSSPTRDAEVQAELAAMALGTAWGQHLDSTGTENEEEYWLVAGAKTPPLVQGGLVLGGLYAGVDRSLLEGLRRLGQDLGLVIQLNDDLADAMEPVPAPDWRRPRGNLPMLYALEAEHGDRDRFRQLVPEIGEGDALEEAQRILLRCGAVSYCAMHLGRHHRRLGETLAALSLPDPSPLEELLARQRRPLERLLRIAAAETPENPPRRD